MNPVSVGIVGCGYWGPNFVRNFDSLAGARVTAVCDLAKDRLDHISKLYPAAAVFTDFQQMLEMAGLDAVVVATPLRSHHALAKAALVAGMHVLVEKPMASSTAECGELIGIAAAGKLVLMVGHTYLYSDAVRKISEIVSSGDIGEISYINCQRLNLGLFQNDINVAWDLAPHDLSIILHVMGERPLTINCQGNDHVTAGIEDVTNMSLSFAGRRFATIQSSWLEPRKVRQITFVGSRKMIVYDDLQPLEKIRIHDMRVERPPHYDNFSEFQYSYHYGDCHIPRLDQKEPLNRMCRHFIDCIQSGGKPLTSGEDGLELVGLLEAADRSLRADGAPVVLER